ncbi:MAG: TetR/AcrR family transcriptional regulator [Halioglobus sp.]
MTREEWLDKGLEFFAARGADGLRVEHLAQALDIAKSGFYCHFKGKDDLLDQILEYWAIQYTEIITHDSALMNIPPKDRLQLSSRMIFELNLAEYDAAIDIWSRNDARVALKWKQVMNTRLTFFRDAFEELGFHGDDLEMRTRTCAVFQMGERQILGSEIKASKKYRNLRLEMLIGESIQ